MSTHDTGTVVLAHLDVMTAVGPSAIDDALDGRRPVFDGTADRGGLTAWNDATIRRRLAEDGDVLGSLVRGLRLHGDARILRRSGTIFSSDG